MGGVLKIARRIWEVDVAGSPVIGHRRGAFSTLLRRAGLRASSDGVLATKKRTQNVSEYMLVLALCLVMELSTIIICEQTVEIVFVLNFNLVV